MATKQFDHSFQCFTSHHRPRDEQILHSYGACIFRPCMCTKWVIETSPSNHYWRRYEVGQWLVFGWLWGWGILDTGLARQKLGKNNTPQSWQLLSPYNRHGAHPPTPPHTTISQHAAQQVYVVKTRENYCFYYLLAILKHNPSTTRCACVIAGCVSGQRWGYHTLSGRHWEHHTLSGLT